MAIIIKSTDKTERFDTEDRSMPERPDDEELKLWEEPPQVQKKQVREATCLKGGLRFDKYTYSEFSDGTLEITKFTGHARDINIPLGNPRETRDNPWRRGILL